MCAFQILKLKMLYSYTVDARVVVKDSSFEISYDDFLTLYNNNDGYVVYNSVIADSYSSPDLYINFQAL